MIFYQRAIALNRERHQKLHIEPVADHFAFAAKTNAVLLASTEIAEAARDHPIVFAGEAGGPFALAALVGLRDDENLLVDETGRWETNTYIPAIARSYPFALAGDDTASVLTVCVDEAYAGLNEERGEALFDDEGHESAYLKRVLDFLRAFHADMQRTREFAARLNELGLLVSKTVTVNTPEGGATDRRVLNGVWVVDEEKLRAIDDARVVELFRNGYMGWIYAHLLSIRNVQRLAVRLQRARPPAAAPAPSRGRKASGGAPASGWNGSERRKKPR